MTLALGVPTRWGASAADDVRMRLAVSAATEAGAQLATSEFDSWFADRRRAHVFDVERVAFAALDGWHFVEGTGNLQHRSGRFFMIEGLQVAAPGSRWPEWHQPIINQPEVGVLGIIAKQIGGVPHFLMQAKMEPGNPNLLQLSPTVQATRSNYTRVHGGTPVRYIEYFNGARPRRVIADVLQSEHGAWFYQKRNRNMVVEVDDDIPPHEDFCWLTLGQLHALLRRDNIVNMDARTVLACLPQPAPLPEGGDRFRAALLASTDADAAALSSNAELLSWFTGQRCGRELVATLVALDGLPGWYRARDEIARADQRFFRVIAVSVRAGNREVSGWTQPLFEPAAPGVAAFIVRSFGGVLHVLAHAKLEGGARDVVELAPTVQCVPSNYAAGNRPFLLDYVLTARPWQIRFDAVHSEEGGRFRDAESRYLIVEADDLLPAQPPPEYAWVTVAQLSGLLRHSHYVNVQARTLLACLSALR